MDDNITHFLHIFFFKWLSLFCHIFFPLVRCDFFKFSITQFRKICIVSVCREMYILGVVCIICLFLYGNYSRFELFRSITLCVFLFCGTIVVVVHVIVCYVQEALKFKLHFNSKLNAEATCEKCLHMCGTLVAVLLLLLLMWRLLMLL